MFAAAAACAQIDEHTPMGLDDDGGEPVDLTDPEQVPPGTAPLLVGELTCAEPLLPGAIERDLPPGTETDPPPPVGLPELFAEIRAGGGRPVLRFDTSHAGERLNVRVPVRREMPTDAEPEELLLDVGAMTVRLAYAPAPGRWGGPELVVPRSLPLSEAVVLKTYTRERDGDALGPAELSMLSVFDRRDEGAGPVATLAVDSALSLRTRALDCDALAYELAAEVPPVAVSFPRLSSCNLDECAKTKAAWLRANHDLYRIRQILDFVAASPPHERAFLWAQEGTDKKGARLASPESEDVGPNTAPEFYFGPYAEYRLNAIRWAYDRLWRDFHDHEVGGLEFDIECTPDGPGDICNTTKPGGHHAVKGNIKLCEKAFTTTSQVFDVPRLLLHESMHHMFVPWRDNLPRLSPILDTHTHGHGPLCLSKLTTNKGYGIVQIKHLASYRNSSDGDCYHTNFAFRNNDTYAYAAATIGTYIRFGFMKTWPAKLPPPVEEESHGTATPECGEAGISVPAPGFVDPLSGCQKIGGELVCPGSHGGVTAPDLDIAAVCPKR
ncbi:MAG TPA: hypothetical protein VIK91_26925 [Nannocystis sp.]